MAHEHALLAIPFFKDGIEGSTVQAMNLDVLNTMHHAVSL